MAYRRRHDRHTPRGWFNLFIRLGGWASLIFGVALVVLTLISATQLYLADRLDRDGRFAQAAVVDKRIAVSTDSDGDTDTDYFVTFRFKTSAGGHQVEDEVSGAFYDRVGIDDEHVIRYLASDPDIIESDIGSYRRGGNVLRLLGLVMGIGGLATLWLFGRQTNRAILARRDGERRLAEVVAIAETNVRVNKRRQGRLVWREPDGRVGESLMRDYGELGRLYKGGDEIVVFRLGDEAWWEGDVGPPAREAGD